MMNLSIVLQNMRLLVPTGKANRVYFLGSPIRPAFHALGSGMNVTANSFEDRLTLGIVGVGPQDLSKFRFGLSLIFVAKKTTNEA